MLSKKIFAQFDPKAKEEESDGVRKKDRATERLMDIVQQDQGVLENKFYKVVLEQDPAAVKDWQVSQLPSELLVDSRYV